MKKIIKKTIKKTGALLLAAIFCVQLLPIATFAAPQVHEVSSLLQLQTAAEVINASGGDHIISLKGNITYDHVDPIRLTKGNTTVLGNGFSITGVAGVNDGLLLVSGTGTTLTLGDSDDATNLLTITTNAATSSSLLYAGSSAILNIYSGVTVDGNSVTASHNSGGISVVYATLNMYGGIVENCVVLTNGGGIFVEGGTVNLQGDTEIRNNTGNNSADGGGIYASTTSTINLSGNAKVTGNNTSRYGGGISVNSGSTLNMSGNSEVSGNGKTAAPNGGGIFASYSTVNLSDSVKISDNKASANGGGIYGNYATIKLEDGVVITNNSAGQLGGGMIANGTKLTVDDTVTIKGNTAGSAANNILFYSYDHLFTLNTTETLDDTRSQLIDIRYGSSTRQLDFAVTGVGASSVTTNEDINRYFSYESSSLIFNIESVANHLILMVKPKIIPTIAHPESAPVGTLLSSIVKAVDGDGREIPGDFQFFTIAGDPLTDPELKEILNDPDNKNHFGYNFIPDDTNAYETLTLKILMIKAIVPRPLPTPVIQIDYIGETLTDFTPNQKYTINGDEFTADATGKIAIDSTYFGTTLTIIAKGNGSDQLDSAPQNLPIPLRPTAPVVTVENNGDITAVNSTMEYSTDGGNHWTTVQNNTITGLSHGDSVLIRYKATNSSFKSESRPITITVKYTVSFHTDGGTVVDDQIVESGGFATEPSPPPTKKDHTFEGWFTDSSFTTPWIFTTDTVNSTITLHAKWKAENNGGGTIEDYHNITITIIGKGDVSPGGEEDRIVQVRDGSDRTFTFTPGAGYIISDVIVDGVSQGPITSYHFSNIKKNHTITILYKKDGELPPIELDTTDHFAYMVGVGDDLFEPDRHLTRAEVTTIFVRLMLGKDGQVPMINTNFTDINGDEWYADYVAYAEEMGIISGYLDGSFKPNQPITRAEFVTIASRFAYLEKMDLERFPDVDGSYWAYEYISSAAQKGWISGYPDGTFKPVRSITRAESVIVINKILGRNCDEQFVDEYIDSLTTFEDVPQTHWAFYDIIEATNSHDHEIHDGQEGWIKP